MIGTHVDREAEYRFIARRLCKVETVWDRRPGTNGIRPFGASTADYHVVERRRCDICPSWSGTYNYRGEHKIYVCRCRLCAHDFKIEEWAASPKGAAFMLLVQNRLAYTFSLRKDSAQFDGLVEVVRIARDFMNLGAIEDAKHTLDDKLAQLKADGLIEEENGF